MKGRPAAIATAAVSRLSAVPLPEQVLNRVSCDKINV
jgi:hypothetical protein